ncbi:methyltransferase domain-containing protein [Pseudoflavitalea sp. G-6-1-2]|uniref:class I SAM-dependent methyltransferase n=1 Tax=Pseudoflavitalea sp. G-6-1-2 TaxID=2728841 RepID=UPI00146B9C69|nr:methyltransferase domain-containing protein [Pseudoflavitalea sp. G-6-1-2]NML23811.1 methyltransferase domain-containing protein [Pseudoflavitalea sp. G-6-1-2]
MAAPPELQHIERPGYSIDLFIPDAAEVQQTYLLQKEAGEKPHFPYWAKLWPAAIAMSDYIHQHPETVQNKTVLELAAGLGMPGLLAARYAKSVCCSDYLQPAVDVMAASAAHSGLSNISCALLDWNNLPPAIETDVLLMSDVNYDTAEFDQLYKVLLSFLTRGTSILLTTPQRLMAKPFIESLLPFCTQQTEMVVDYQEQQIAISILQLQQFR